MLILQTSKSPACENTSVALGIFDGVHKGHREVIEKASMLANESNTALAVFTFQTSTITSKGDNYIPIYTDDIKISLLEKLGVKYTYMPKFSQLKDLSPKEFVIDVLKKVMNAKHVICGSDFRMGKNAACDTAMLKELCEQNDMTLTVVNDITDDICGRISSAQIRELLSNGSIPDANRLLGNPYFIKGEVIHGNHLGRILGFPTINQRIDDNIVLVKFGVYATEAEIDGVIYRGVTNIGVKPTVEKKISPLAETYFPEYTGDLYGRVITIKLFKFIREEKKFDSIESLKAQVDLDKKIIMSYESLS